MPKSKLIRLALCMTLLSAILAVDKHYRVEDPIISIAFPSGPTIYELATKTEPSPNPRWYMRQGPWAAFYASDGAIVGAPIATGELAVLEIR